MPGVEKEGDGERTRGKAAPLCIHMVGGLEEKADDGKPARLKAAPRGL